MTVIRVSPQSVSDYGRDASAKFEAIHSTLTALVNNVVDVRYYAPNAVKFKTECGQLAASFANSLHADIGGMADAVRASTSNIAASLGGAPISIHVDPRAITPPTPATTEFVDLDTSALEALVGTVSGHFDSIVGQLDAHMGKLQATDWEGNAKLAAVDAVASLTASAKSKCTAAQTSISSYIRSQIDSSVSSDTLV